MAPQPPSADAAPCHADPRCRRAVCFRIQPRAQSGEALGPPAGACAEHLGEVAAGLVRRARADGLSEGYLEVSAIAPGTRPPAGLGSEPSPVCLPFASITLAS